MVLTVEQRRYLENTWTNVKQVASFTGPTKLLVYQIVKSRKGLKGIKDCLSDLKSYSFQNNSFVQRKFPRLHIF